MVQFFWLTVYNYNYTTTKNKTRVRAEIFHFSRHWLKLSVTQMKHISNVIYDYGGQYHLDASSLKEYKLKWTVEFHFLSAHPVESLLFAESLHMITGSHRMLSAGTQAMNDMLDNVSIDTVQQCCDVLFVILLPHVSICT